MTIEELIVRLEEYQKQCGPDCEVRLMAQKSYPIEHEITGLVSAEEMAAGSGDCDTEEEADAIEPMLYIVEGSQVGYGSKIAWDAAY